MDSSAVYGATSRRPIETSQTMPQLPVAHRIADKLDGQLWRPHKMPTTSPVQNRHDRNAIFKCCHVVELDLYILFYRINIQISNTLT